MITLINPPGIKSFSGLQMHTPNPPLGLAYIAAALKDAGLAYQVIDGTGLRFGHMVAYDHGRIYDPKGHVYDYSRIACEAHQFYTRCAWRIDPIGESICE